MALQNVILEFLEEDFKLAYRAVSLAYFDTSVLVKNYIRETGSKRVRKLVGTSEFVSSAIAPIETPFQPFGAGIGKVN